jgi:carbonic anhydrase
LHYQLTSLHIHSDSEHIIDGKKQLITNPLSLGTRYPIELQFIHELIDSDIEDYAYTQAILSIFFLESEIDEENTFFQSLNIRSLNVPFYRTNFCISQSKF